MPDNTQYPNICGAPGCGLPADHPVHDRNYVDENGPQFNAHDFDDGWHYENASVEVWRWGPVVRLAIRSEDSKGKAVEMTLGEARTLAEQLYTSSTSQQRKVRDEPQA